MDNKLIDLEELKKRYVVLQQSEDFATNTVILKVFDVQENAYKTLEYDKFIFYKYVEIANCSEIPKS